MCIHTVVKVDGTGCSNIRRGHNSTATATSCTPGKYVFVLFLSMCCVYCFVWKCRFDNNYACSSRIYCVLASGCRRRRYCLDKMNASNNICRETIPGVYANTVLPGNANYPLPRQTFHQNLGSNCESDLIADCIDLLTYNINHKRATAVHTARAAPAIAPWFSHP